MLVSELSYGNWITHGSQIEAEQANACVRAALELGITTFDTADVYAGTRAETVLGEALKGLKLLGLRLSVETKGEPNGPETDRSGTINPQRPPEIEVALGSHGS